MTTPHTPLIESGIVVGEAEASIIRWREWQERGADADRRRTVLFRWSLAASIVAVVVVIVVRMFIV